MLLYTHYASKMLTKRTRIYNFQMKKLENFMLEGLTSRRIPPQCAEPQHDSTPGCTPAAKIFAIFMAMRDWKWQDTSSQVTHFTHL